MRPSLAQQCPRTRAIVVEITIATAGALGPAAQAGMTKATPAKKAETVVCDVRLTTLHPDRVAPLPV